MASRRIILAGLGAATAAGVGALGGYRAAPSFWRQYWHDLRRDIAPAPARPDFAQWDQPGVHAAWLGHSTVLLRIDGYTVITDPVFSARAGIDLGLVTLGVKRLTAPALTTDLLPQIDLILLSHAHMDHFDLPSLRALEHARTQVITAPSTMDLLARPERYGRGVSELRWGQKMQAGPVTVRAIEVNHWGARLRTDTHRGYNGYVIETAQRRVLFAGDTAWTDSFRSLRTSRDFDLAIMPIGAYNPWIRYHCTPEQAWTMGNAAGAARFMPVHHRTFPLGREPVNEPMQRFLTAAGGRGEERIVLRRIGEQVSLG